MSFFPVLFSIFNNSSTFIWHFPIHRKPFSLSSSNPIGSPSGARLDFTGNIYRFQGSSLSLDTIRILLAAAAMSMLPNPLYNWFPPPLLFICPTNTIAQLVSAATLDNFDKISRIFTAFVIFPL